MDKHSSLFPSPAAPIAVYGHPQPTLRRLTARIIAAGLALALVGAAGQAVMALTLGAAGLLLWISTLFTLGFAAVLVALATLHPEVTVYEDGLLLRPLVGRAARVAWSALAVLEPHPLIFNNEGMGRLLHGKNYRPRAGLLVVVRPGAGLSMRFRLVDLVTGGPGRPVFAISNATHANYERLEKLIRERTAP